MRRVMVAVVALAGSACLSPHTATTAKTPAPATDSVSARAGRAPVIDSTTAARLRAFRAEMDSLSERIRAQRAEIERLKVETIKKPQPSVI